MTKKSKFYTSIIVGVAVLGFCFSSCGRRPYQRQSRLIMGTVIEITARDETAIEAAFAEIERIDALLSSYNSDSEVSRLNKRRKLEASDELIYLIKKAKYFYQLTGGAFDVTVGPLVKLWDIKGNMKKDIESIRLPSDSKIRSALSHVGLNLVEIDEKSSIIKLKDKNVVIDLGGIAKGYAVDRAVKVLKEFGVKSALINAGGDIYCLGSKAASFWRIGLQNPHQVDKIVDKFRLKNRAVATSGDYEQFFVYANKRYSHIIDPRLGYPVDNSISSVTVLADDCLTADVLATAIFVLGELRGRQLVEEFKNVEVKIMTR